jgi:hypothetical protein
MAGSAAAPELSFAALRTTVKGLIPRRFDPPSPTQLREISLQRSINNAGCRQKI